MPFISTDSATFDAATNRYSLSIDENSPVGSVIGKASFDGGGPGETLYTLSGPDAGKVRLAPDGTLTLAPGVVPDFEAAGDPPRINVTVDALFLGEDPEDDDDMIDSGSAPAHVAG